MSNSLRVTSPGDFIEFSAVNVGSSISSRFEAAARANPDRIALSDSEKRLTFEEVNRAANRVAHSILSIRPFTSVSASVGDRLNRWEEHADVITVLMPQSVDGMIAILGVLKAGKMVTVVDPATLPTQIKQILDHASSELLIYSESVSDVEKGLASDSIRGLSYDLLESGGSAENPDLELSSSAPAFLNYTSGSTGNPKGVAFCHGDVLHDLGRKTNLLKISFSDRLIIPTWATGQATKTALSALLNGASAHFFNLKREGVQGVSACIKLQGITVLTMPAPVLRSFLASLDEGESFPSVRLVRPVSDSIYPEDIGQMKGRFADSCTYVNALGSSETGSVCAFLMNDTTSLKEGALRRSGIPIGVPLSGVDATLLDDAGQRITGPGTGTISIRSQSVARGYWKNPSLTSTLFEYETGDSRADFRTFHSADLAERQVDGSLLFLGRNDFQVKIRGYRVDLGEVEAALLSHENVIEAVVDARKNSTGEKGLVGYFVSRDFPAPTTSALHEHLARHLSAHMIPEKYVELSEIPLLPSGKTDRKSLPDPGHERPDLDKPFRPPRSVLEHKLARIWERTFDIDRVGRKDNFFDLGGNSMLAAQVMNEVGLVIDSEPTIATLFDAPTIKQLAMKLAAGSSTPALVNIQSEGELSPLYCVHGWGGHVYWFLELARLLAPHRPVYGLQALGMDGNGPRHTTTMEMAEHYAEELLSKNSDKHFFLTGYSAGAWMAFAVASVLRARGVTVHLCLLDPRLSCEIPILIRTAYLVGGLPERLFKHAGRISEMPLRNIGVYVSSRLRLVRRYFVRERVSQDAVEANSRANMKTISEASPDGKAQEVDFSVAVIRNYAPQSYEGDVSIVTLSRFNLLEHWFWKRYVRGKLELVRLNGIEHHQLMRLPFVKQLEPVISSIMNRKDGSEGGISL